MWDGMQRSTFALWSMYFAGDTVGAVAPIALVKRYKLIEITDKMKQMLIRQCDCTALERVIIESSSPAAVTDMCH